MPKEKTNKKSRTLGRIIIFILIGAVVSTTLVFSFYQMSRNLYLERRSNTQLLVGQIALNLDDSLGKQMGYVEHFARVYERNGYTTLEESYEYLLSMVKTSGEEVDHLYLIDDKAICYSSREVPFRWRNREVILSTEPSCLLSTKEYSVSANQSILFVVPFKEPVTLKECTMTHMVMSTNMDVVDKFFDVEYFGEGNTSFILNRNGSQAHLSNNNNEISQVYNLLKAMEGVRFNYGASVEQLKADINDGKPGCMHIEMDGLPYYLVYEPLEMNDWMAVMLIEEEHIAGASDSFVRSLIMTIGFIALIALVTIVTVVIISAKNVNKRLLIASEAERKAETERKANEAKTRFLSSMSHDIRTPMNAIIGMSNLAAANIDNREYALECLGKVKMSSDHLLTLINDVLDISKVESGKMRLSPSVFMLENEVKRLVEIIRPQAEEKSQEFVQQLSGLEDKWFYADKLRVNQVMLNILSNAVKYTQVGGKIILDVTAKPSAVSDEYEIVYCVKDNGIGMTEEFQKTMYDTFTREDNEPKKNIQGSGLGLSICKQMVDLLGGTIECVSAPGVGTTFTVRVSLKCADETQIAENVKNSKSVDEISLSGLRILVAEDNDFNWEVANAVLDVYGIETVRAENGQICYEMLEKAEDNEYDLVLMDIQMPVMNGYQATEAIRASQRRYLNTIPIVAMTADAFTEDIHHCKEVGMNEHLSKPIDVDELINVIKRMK